LERESIALGSYKGLCHTIATREIAVIVGIDPETMEEISFTARGIGMG
jgi:hypothetical protein